MPRQEADQWVKDVLDVDVASASPSPGGSPGGGGASAGTKAGATPDAGQSADVLMQRAADKAEAEFRAAAADAQKKEADVVTKREAAAAALKEAEAKFGTEYEIETALDAERKTEKVAPAHGPATRDPSSTELLQQALAKAKADVAAAGARAKQAAAALDKAEADAKAARAYSNAKLNAYMEVEAAATAATKLNEPKSWSASGEWKLNTEKWNYLKNLEVFVYAINRKLICTAQWQYSGEATKFPVPPMVHAEFELKYAMATKTLAAPAGPILPVTAPRYDFRGEADLTWEMVAGPDPLITATCHIIMEGSELDRFSEVNVLRLVVS